MAIMYWILIIAAAPAMAVIGEQASIATWVERILVIMWMV